MGGKGKKDTGRAEAEKHEKSESKDRQETGCVGDKYLFRLDPSDPSTNREGRIKAEDQGRAWAFTGNCQRGSLRYDY